MFWQVKIANFFEEEDIAGFSPTSGFPNAPNIFFHGDFAILTSQTEVKLPVDIKISSRSLTLQ